MCDDLVGGGRWCGSELVFGLVWFVFFFGLWHETHDVDFSPNEKIVTVFWFNKFLNLSCAVPFFGCYRLGLGSRASSRMHTLFWFRPKNTFGITMASTPLWPFDASHTPIIEGTRSDFVSSGSRRRC